MLHLIWLVLFYTWFASEIFLVIRSRARKKTGHQLRDRGSLLILWATISLSMFIGIFVGESLPPNIPGDKFFLHVIALSILIFGIIIRWGAIIKMGRAFSINVALHKDQHVIQSGLFHFIRHPSYLGMLIIFFATTLNERNYYSIAIILIPIIVALLYRIHVEELALREGFGAEYIEYSKRTKRLIPFIY
jgi:protein-S-isoprenylcysteine O-methyltransferase Ste14